MIQMKKESK